MKQLLLRIPDDLHARITDRARRSGRSANAIATELLDREVADESSDARATLRARARRLGVLAASPATPEHTAASTGATRRAALDAMRGTGPILDGLLEDGR